MPVCLGRHEVVLAPAALVLGSCLCQNALLHVCEQKSSLQRRNVAQARCEQCLQHGMARRGSCAGLRLREAATTCTQQLPDALRLLLAVTGCLHNSPRRLCNPADGDSPRHRPAYMTHRCECEGNWYCVRARQKQDRWLHSSQGS